VPASVIAPEQAASHRHSDAEDSDAKSSSEMPQADGEQQPSAPLRSPKRSSALPAWPVLALVCGFTALQTFKPSEPYLVPFMHCVRGVPRSTIVDSIFPFWTYAQLALLPLLSAGSELFGYRAVVLLGMLGRLATLLLLLYGGDSVFLLQLSQVAIAVGFAAHPSLVAILFRSLPSESYARAVGLVASAGVLSEVAASFVGQMLVNAGAHQPAATSPYPPSHRRPATAGPLAGRLMQQRSCSGPPPAPSPPLSPSSPPRRAPVRQSRDLDRRHRRGDAARPRPPLASAAAQNQVQTRRRPRRLDRPAAAASRAHTRPPGGRV